LYFSSSLQTVKKQDKKGGKQEKMGGKRKGKERKGWWNGLGRAGVPVGLILGEQVAVGSL